MDEVYLIKDDRWPVEDNSINLIVCDNVMEHVNHPGRFFSEARRVLKNQGFLCIRTTNRWSYVAFFSKLIPNRYHSRVMNVVQDQRKEQDVFPTVYKCNTVRSIKQAMENSGFEYIVYGYEAEPPYFSFSKAAYWIGVMHQKFAPGFLKPTIFAFGRIQKRNA